MTALPTTARLRTGVAPGLTPRLMRQEPGREDLAAYTGTGGYAAQPEADAFIDAVELSGLRGRGGAAFPAGQKLRTVRAAGGPPVVVANGEEGEPMSVKDRWLLRTRPHLVLDGLRLAAAAVGADTGYVYLSDPAAERSVLDAMAEMPAGGVRFTVRRVQPGYVAGEETAAVQALDGGPAVPTDKPPRPFEAGVHGRPTLVSNVETLANLPFIASAGAQAFREQGTDRAPGTFLLTLGGAVEAPGLYEVPLGTALADVLEQLAGRSRAVPGALVGGYFAGLLGAQVAQTQLDYDSLLESGSGLGCGAVGVLADDACPVAVAGDVLAYFSRENAGQCGSCFNGTAAMSAAVQALRSGTGTADNLAQLDRWSRVLRGRGACGTLDGATNVAGSLLREFRPVVEAHLDAACAACGEPPDDLPFAVPYDEEVPG